MSAMLLRTSVSKCSDYLLQVDLANDALAGELSPDKSKCMVWMPLGEPDVIPGGVPPRSVLHLYDLRTATLLREFSLNRPGACHFAFDPRFAWRRAAVTNFDGGLNSLSLVDIDVWEAVSQYINSYSNPFLVI